MNLEKNEGWNSAVANKNVFEKRIRRIYCKCEWDHFEKLNNLMYNMKAFLCWFLPTNRFCASLQGKVWQPQQITLKNTSVCLKQRFKY